MNNDFIDFAEELELLASRAKILGKSREEIMDDILVLAKTYRRAFEILEQDFIESCAPDSEKTVAFIS